MSEEKVVKRPARKAPRKKVCTFCVDKATEIDYKDVAKLRKFITEKGKIVPRRITYKDKKSRLSARRAVYFVVNAHIVRSIILSEKFDIYDLKKLAVAKAEYHIKSIL